MVKRHEDSDTYKYLCPLGRISQSVVEQKENKGKTERKERRGKGKRAQDRNAAEENKSNEG